MAPPPHELSPPPLAPSATKKRLGLATGLEKAGSRKLVLKPKGELSSSRSYSVKLTLDARAPARPSAAASSSSNADYVQQALTTLTRATRAILCTQPTPESLQALYTLCENAVSSGNSTAQLLYDRIRLEVERQTVEVRKELNQGAQEEGEESWLTRWDQQAKRFREQVLLIRSVFLHLDRTYVLREPGLLSLW